MNENVSQKDLDLVEEYIDDLNQGRSSDVFGKMTDKELLPVLKAARDAKAAAADDEVDATYARNLRHQILQETKGKEVHQAGAAGIWRWLGFSLGAIGVVAAVLGVALVVTNQKNNSGALTVAQNTNTTTNQNASQATNGPGNQNKNESVDKNQSQEIVQITNESTVKDNQPETTTTILPDGEETLVIAGGEDIENDVAAAASVEVPIGTYEVTQVQMSADAASIEATVNEVDQWLADPVYAQLADDISQIKL